MRVIDLHCDTLYKKTVNNTPLDSRDNECQLCGTKDDRKLQCYAIWLPDSLSGDEAEQLFFKAADDLKRDCKRLDISLLKSYKGIKEQFEKNQNSAVLTVENSTALNSKLENVKKFASLGIKMMTLTWNAENPSCSMMLRKTRGDRLLHLIQTLSRLRGISGTLPISSLK